MGGGATAILAGILDVLEDIAILLAASDGAGWAIRPFGKWKWALVFATALLEAPVFLAWSSLPMTGRILSLLIGGGFLGVAILGLQSVLLDCDALLETDSAGLAAVFLLLAIFSVWRFVHLARKPARLEES